MLTLISGLIFLSPRHQKHCYLNLSSLDDLKKARFKIMCTTFLPEYMRVGRGAMKVGYCQNIVKIRADKISILSKNGL